MSAVSSEAIRHLRRRDPVLSRLIKDVGPLEIRKGRDIYGDLIHSILSQQLSMKAASTIIGRFKNQHGGRLPPAAQLAKASLGHLRKAGISRQKAGYLRDLAARHLERPLRGGELARWSDEAVIERLIEVKGVGVWTAKMILIFTMARPDVMPHEDLGIQLAVKQFYGLRRHPTEGVITRLAESWRPYRSIASRYLWRARDKGL